MKKYLTLLKISIIAPIIGATVGIFLLYIAFQKLLPDLSNTKNNSVADNPTAPVVQEPATPIIGMFQKSQKTITLFWDHLAQDIQTIIIYQSKDQTTWAPWKTITVPSSRRGSIDIAIGPKENPGQFTYYFEGISSGGQNGTGTVIFTSPTSTLLSATSTQIPSFVATSSPTSTPNNQTPTPTPSSTATSTSTTTTPSSTPTSTPITANPTSTPTPSTPNYQYYTPQGGPSGPGFQTLTSQHFWVVRADDGIELGWNDLPANTIEIIIYRSVSENGNWKNIFSQQYDTATRFIRLVDSSIGVTYYYKLEARNGNNALVATYGPEKLTAQ